MSDVNIILSAVQCRLHSGDIDEWSRKALIDKLESVKQSLEWNTNMDEAPKDGTRVLLNFEGDTSDCGRFEKVPDGNGKKDVWSIGSVSFGSSDFYTVVHPTKWKLI